MSSSKIIKQADHDRTGISEFSFRNIGRTGEVVAALKNKETFVPMEFFQGGGSNSSAQEESDGARPPAVEISEEDLNQRINDAFNAGLKEGKELAERGLINVFRALRAASETIHNMRGKILRETEYELIDMVMLVARKVIIREVSQDRSILSGVVQHALAGLSAREEITLRINPDDYLLITSGHEELLHKELLNERLLFKPDPSVAAGFCLVDTAMGTIDASLDGQMVQIYRSLLEQRTAVGVEEQ